MKSLLEPGLAPAGFRMPAPPETNTVANGAASLPLHCGTAFGCTRNFFDNRFVYTVISPRVRGLSLGVNMNPDKRCNFNCVYCEVNRSEPSRESRLDVLAMISELGRTMQSVSSGGLRERYC